jgi:hypothetical protein
LAACRALGGLAGSFEEEAWRCPNRPLSCLDYQSLIYTCIVPMTLVYRHYSNEQRRSTESSSPRWTSLVARRGLSSTPSFNVPRPTWLLFEASQRVIVLDRKRWEWLLQLLFISN